MLTDIRTVMWKEGKHMWDQVGGASVTGRLTLLAFVGVFGVFSPWVSGPTWISSPLLLFVYPFAAAAVVIQPVIDSFAGERERHTLETLLASRLSDSAILFGKMLAALLSGCGFAGAMLLLGILAANLMHGHGGLLRPPAWLAVGAPLLIVALAGFVATGGVFVSLRAPTVRQATQTFGFVILAVMLGPLLIGSFLPAATKAMLLTWVRGQNATTMVLLAAGALLALDGVFLAAAFRQFRRGRLTLD